MEKHRGWGIAVMRVVAGVVFLMHGGQKLFVRGFADVGRSMGMAGIPLPEVAGVVVTLVEFFGGILLIVGLFTRPAATLLAVNMAVAVLVVHLPRGFFLPGGVEFALTLLAACVMLVLAGPGKAALDGRLTRLGYWR